MLTAEQVRDCIHKKFPSWSHAAIGAELGLSAGFVGMVLSGEREPSKAILEALEMERVSFYRPKGTDDLPDAIRVPLHELQADVNYLVGRVVADGSCGPMIATSIQTKLAAIEAALVSHPSPAGQS